MIPTMKVLIAVIFLLDPILSVYGDATNLADPTRPDCEAAEKGSLMDANQLLVESVSSPDGPRHGFIGQAMLIPDAKVQPLIDSVRKAFAFGCTASRRQRRGGSDSGRPDHD